MLISVVIPVYNGGHFLVECLRSLANQYYESYEVIVNDDPRSTDDAEGVVEEMRGKGMNVRYLRRNTSMALGRKEGAAVAKGEVLVHLDVDMQISGGLLGECAELIESGYDALVIPEESYGTSFWAMCRWLERKCYTGVEPLEALRCIRNDIYRELGGHNPEMVYFEDKDFDLRVRRQGYEVGSTENLIHHNEGDLSLRVILRKRVGYARSAVIAARYYPDEIRLRGACCTVTGSSTTTENSLPPTPARPRHSIYEDLRVRRERLAFLRGRSAIPSTVRGRIWGTAVETRALIYAITLLGFSLGTRG